MKLDSRVRLESFLEAYNDLINQIYLKYQTDYQKNNFPGKTPDLRVVDAKEFVLTPAEFPNLVHDKLNVLIAIFNKLVTASSKKEDSVSIQDELQELSFIMQHNVTLDNTIRKFFKNHVDMLSDEERTTIQPFLEPSPLHIFFQNNEEVNEVNNDKGKEEAPEQAAAYRSLYREFCYEERTRSFISAIDNEGDISTFKKDFLRTHRLNGQKRLGFGDRPTEKISDDEVIDRVHEILGGNDKISRDKVIQLMNAYCQPT